MPKIYSSQMPLTPMADVEADIVSTVRRGQQAGLNDPAIARIIGETLQKMGFHATVTL